MAAKIVKNTKSPSLEPMFGLSILGYGRNMAVQHERGLAPPIERLILT